MIRPNLHEILVSEWTPAEAFHHLKGTFDRAAKQHPELFEQYQVMLADAEDEASIMREALRETFTSRYPNPYLKPYQEEKE